VTQEAQPVGIRREPRFIKTRGIVMRDMGKAHREAVVEAFGKGGSCPFGFDEVQKRVPKVSFVLSR
jgi:hypothetical protein